MNAMKRLLLIQAFFTPVQGQKLRGKPATGSKRLSLGQMEQRDADDCKPFGREINER